LQAVGSNAKVAPKGTVKSPFTVIVFTARKKSKSVLPIEIELVPLPIVMSDFTDGVVAVTVKKLDKSVLVKILEVFEQSNFNL
jgi:hypothetical protein